MVRLSPLYETGCKAVYRKDIGCRACWKLHYKSQSADRLDRMRMKIRQQRYAIWGNNDLTNNLFNDIRMFPKPKDALGYV
jgi:hypothetical protein